MTQIPYFIVFKAKYFPMGIIFYAKAGSGSYAWKSILKARKVILLGARWRIGDGSSVKIFKDSWLPGAHSGRVLSSISVLSEEAMVVEHKSGGHYFHTFRSTTDKIHPGLSFCLEGFSVLAFFSN